MKESEKWFNEEGEWGEQHAYQYNEILYEKKTEYQDVKIFSTTEYGKILVLDGFCQSAENDEYIYHEALVHPALTMHKNPQSVLIIGGGEGATAREVLKHPSITNVVMVDIDGELVNACNELLPEWNNGAFQDPRLHIVIQDGLQYVDCCNELYDCIIIDVCDDLDDGPAHALYTPEFYKKLKTLLTPQGILVVQAMEIIGLKPDLLKSDHLKVQNNIRQVYKNIAVYRTFIPSFWSEWGFVVASDSIKVNDFLPIQIDNCLQERNIFDKLKLYDGITHQNMFSLPRNMRTVMQSAC